MDFAGPSKGKMFLILVDGHSKWPEVIEMSTTTSELFARYGLPEQLVSDNEIMVHNLHLKILPHSRKQMESNIFAVLRITLPVTDLQNVLYKPLRER